MNVFTVNNTAYEIDYEYLPGNELINLYDVFHVFPEIVKTVNNRHIIREKGFKNHYIVYSWIKNKDGKLWAKSYHFRTIKAAAEYIEKNDQLIRETRCDQ